MAASWHTFYSYAGGIFHFYYLATLAALAGIGVVRLWGCYVGERVACRPASRCAAPDGRVADASRELVDPALWRAGAGPRMQLYDLRPEAGVVPAPPECPSGRREHRHRRALLGPPEEHPDPLPHPDRGEVPVGAVGLPRFAFP